MNKTLIATALFSTLIASTALAANTTTPVTKVAALAPTNTATAPGTPATATTPAAAPATATPATPAAPINCNYHIPKETTTIDQSVISTWAKIAAVQSFDFNPATLDEQLTQLKACFTEQGWQGFNEALQKSGNIDAIKSQHLTVSSQVDGNVSINPVKDNQWKVGVPMQVVYQNEKEKLTQSLSIELLIGRKPTGDLGIMQVIATPRKAPATSATGK